MLVGFSTTEAVAALSDPLTAIILPFTLGVDDCFTFAFGFPAINQGQIKQQMTACGKTQKTELPRHTYTSAGSESNDSNIQFICYTVCSIKGI